MPQIESMKQIGARADSKKVKELGSAIFELADKLGCNAADLAECCDSICRFLEQNGLAVCLPCNDETVYN